MRKKLLVILITLFAINPAYAFAMTPASNSANLKAAQNTSAKTDRVAKLKEKADQAIDRRTTSLGEIVTKIGGFKHLSADQKSALVTQIQPQIDSLNVLKTKIDADTDLATLQTDVKSIVATYRIYALFIPQVHTIAASNTILDITGIFEELSTKLAAKITEMEATGVDVTAAKAKLEDLNKQVTDAKLQANNAIAAVTPLTPDGYPGNKTTLQSARKMIITARADLIAARKDAQAIVSPLRTEKQASNSGKLKLNSPSSPSAVSQ